jgi:secreted PhoX family phosphatase
MMTRISRRDFFRRAAEYGGGSLLAPSLAGLTAWNFAAPPDVHGAVRVKAGHAASRGYGPLKTSQDCPEFMIPEGFRCMRLSTTSQASSANPSLIVPNAVDGMGSFALPNGNVRLIRNHEVVDNAERARPIGARPYDAKAGGGTTSLEVELRGEGDSLEVRLVNEFVSLSGTHTNCAGGRTPWGSWLSCEETTRGPGQGFEQHHGYVFEVPVDATGPVDPVPLKDMGRMVHEAVAVDPDTGTVYLTEDMRWNPEDLQAMPGAGFYRFIPNTREQLARGGRLQILVVEGRPAYNTVRGQTAGTTIDAVWMDIDDPDPAGAERDPSALFRAAVGRGAAIFHRLEGCFYGDESIYFVSTSGGERAAGQVWRYRPDGDDGGALTLVFESPARDVLDSPDNICMGPDDSVVICEDGGADQFIRMLTPASEIIDLVRAPVVQGQREPTEFAGSCFSPDGRVLFFNQQGSTTSYGPVRGATYALWGDW